MADVILDVDYNITKAEANAQKLNAQFEKAKQKLEEQRQKVSETEQKMRAMSKETAKQKALLDSKVDVTIKEAETYEKMAFDTEKITNEYKKQNAQLNLDKANLDVIGNKIKDSTSKSKALNSVWSKINPKYKRASTELGRNARRIRELIKSALFFSVLTKAFTALREQFGKIIAKDKQMSAYINQIKSNLLVIGYQLYDSMKPAIEFILKAVLKITQVLSFILTSVFGKGARSAKSIANSMKKTADEAKKVTASFDTLQTAETQTSGANNGIGGLATAEDIQQMTTSALVKIATISGLAMIGLGLILLLTGANIPLGLGLIVGGGLITYKTIKANWGALDQPTKDSLQQIMTFAGMFMLAMGIILLCCGIIPLGLGFVVAGAGSLVSAYAMQPDRFVQNVKEIMRKIEQVMQQSINWIRKNFFDDLFGKGAGEQLNGFLQTFKDLWSNIIGFISSIAKGDWRKAMKSLVNVAISVLNLFIGTFNSFWLAGFNLISKGLKGLGKIVGKDWGFSTEGWGIPKIPMLANGAVIPGGKPFMAMLGDQKAGQTNIEAPLETIVEAVRIAIGQPNFTIEATGSMSQLIKLLNLKITQEQKRASVF